MTDKGQIKGNAPATNSEVQGFADKVDSAMGSMSFLAYLFDPTQPSFEKYTGTFPSGLRENMTGLMEMASMLGMGGNIAEMLAPNLEEIANQMTPEKIMTILDGLDAGQFEKIYANESMKAIITDISAPIIEKKMGALKLSEALEKAGMASINLDAFEHEGQKLVDQNFMGLKEEDSIRNFSSNISPLQTLAFLDSLPDNRKAEFLKVLAAERDENGDPKLDADGAIIPMKDAEGKPVSFAGLSIEQAIEARAKVGLATDSVMGKFNAVTGLIGAGSDFGLDGARAGVYAQIRTSIPSSFMEIIKEQQTTPPAPSAADMFKALTDSLADKTENGGRQTILNAITAGMDGKDGIRNKLMAIEDATFLTQFLPQEMVDEKIGDGIRSFLSKNGFLQPIIAAIGSFLPFISKMLRGFGMDGVADKLEGATNIAKLQQDGLSLEANNAASGQPPIDDKKEVGADANATVRTDPVPPGGTPAVIVNGN